MTSARQDALSLSEQRLQLALAVGKLGSWQFTLPDRTLVASEQCKANHGLPPDAPITLGDPAKPRRWWRPRAPAAVLRVVW